MSWSGTVYCRYCYEKGHNKRTCPQYTARLKELALREIEEHGEYNGYYGKMYNKRVRKTGLYADGSPMSAEAKKATKQKRVCKYCGLRGHNRRTCERLKLAKKQTADETLSIRNRVFEAMKKAGLGVGAILTKEEYGVRQGYMVTGFLMNQLTSENVRHNPQVIRTKALKTEGVSRWNLEPVLTIPALEGIPELEDAWVKVEVAAPVSAAQVEAAITQEAINDLDFIDGLYAERQSEDYWENSYNS